MNETRRGNVEAELREIADRVAASCGVEVVELRLLRGGSRWSIRLDIDRPGVPGVGIDDCQSVSRALEAILDEDDPVPGSYTLEVSSPGIERPIRSTDDVRRNTGREVTVEATDAEGKPFRVDGTLLGLEDDGIRVLVRDDDREVRIPLDRVTRAHQQIPF